MPSSFCACRICASTAFRWVISVPIAAMPSTPPSASSRSVVSQETSRGGPSAHRMGLSRWAKLGPEPGPGGGTLPPAGAPRAAQPVEPVPGGELLFRPATQPEQRIVGEQDLAGGIRNYGRQLQALEHLLAAALGSFQGQLGPSQLGDVPRRAPDAQ